MFAVIFEVNSRPEARDAYLDHAATLRPELVAIEGFISNERFASLGRAGGRWCGYRATPSTEAAR